MSIVELTDRLEAVRKEIVEGCCNNEEMRLLEIEEEYLEEQIERDK